MRKLDMAIKIASALLGIEVGKLNWKVKDLMKSSHAELESHMKLADRITAAALINGRQPSIVL